MDRLRALDPGVVALTAVILAFGLAMLMSATGPIAVQRTGDSLFYVKRQLLSGVLPGLFGFFTLALIDYRRWRPFAFFSLVASILLLLLVYIPGVGFELGGAHSWVSLGGFTFQPSELVKLTFLVYVAAWLAVREREDVRSFERGFIPFFGAVGLIALMLILQPDTGTMSVIVGTALVLYLVSGAPLHWFAGVCVLGLTGLYLLIKSSPYRTARYMTFLHPELDPKGIGYHINQALLAIGSGGIWGVGFGHSRQKYLYLPEVESDSIIAVIGEEMGWITIVVLLSLYVALVLHAFRIGRAARDPFGMYLAVGIGAWMGIQVVLNIGSMTGLLPMTGVTLPLISHGGSSLAVSLTALGLLAGIPQHAGARPSTL